ncbi:alpha/beta-type small acid-soluble spore protein [Cohnella sp. GCM10027633]|uniref:alpha/beta-type small acid-soluble spore protein n=1 Tax=unclassified Cohnella TaxID=2636738 RepID=UPI0036276C26
MASNNSRNSNNLVVPQARQALDQFKYEVAQQLGIQLSQDGYNGNLLTRDAGSIGGQITRRLVEIAEQQLAGSASGSFMRR